MNVSPADPLVGPLYVIVDVKPVFKLPPAEFTTPISNTKQSPLLKVAAVGVTAKFTAASLVDNSTLVRVATVLNPVTLDHLYTIH
jgi:hypothetical protein